MSSNKTPLDPILNAAAAAEQEAMFAAADPEVRLSLLEGRLASIEPLLEQNQANAAISTALTQYIKDLQEEQAFFNKARYGVGIASIFVMSVISITLFLAVFHWKSPLFKAEPHVVAVFIVAMLSGMVFIVNTIAKGVFRSTVERHADGYLPPALEKAAEYADKMMGKGN